jgi:hypothetical protein
VASIPLFSRASHEQSRRAIVRELLETLEAEKTEGERFAG